jgi:hypothetical protein
MPKKIPSKDEMAEFKKAMSEMTAWRLDILSANATKYAEALGAFRAALQVRILYGRVHADYPEGGRATRPAANLHGRTRRSLAQVADSHTPLVPRGIHAYHGIRSERRCRHLSGASSNPQHEANSSLGQLGTKSFIITPDLTGG